MVDMDKLDLNKKREDLDRIRNEIHTKAMNDTDDGLFWDLTELANRLEMDMIFNQDENQFDFKIFLDLTKNRGAKISRFVTYMREYLNKFCKNKHVTISVRVE